MKPFFPGVMRITYYYSLLCTLSIILITACSEHEDIRYKNNNGALPSYRYLNRGDAIKGVHLFPYMSNSSENCETQYITKQSISDIIFSIRIDADLPIFKLGNKALNEELEIKVNEYLDSKAEIFRVDNKSHGILSENQSYEQFFTAFIDGEIEITSDQILFGMEPGENLMPFMRVVNNNSCQPVGIKEPYSMYHQDEIEELSADKILCNESWLRFEYFLKFKDSPEEIYEEITFYLRMPMIKEHTMRYIGSLITNLDFGDHYENVVYEANTKIGFDNK